MSLEEFKTYVSNSGVDFDGLSDDKKGEWRERFDRSRFEAAVPAGKSHLEISFPSSNQI
jgi:hypothetical protein